MSLILRFKGLIFFCIVMLLGLDSRRMGSRGVISTILLCVVFVRGCGALGICDLINREPMDIFV